MVHYIGIGGYLICVGVVFVVLWFSVRHHHQDRFATCWTQLEDHLSEMADETRDARYEAEIIRQSKQDIAIIRDHVRDYEGPVDIRNTKRSNISLDNIFLREVLHFATHGGEYDTVLSTAIRDAITYYNEDRDKEPVTIALLIETIIHFFEETFIETLLKDHP